MVKIKNKMVSKSNISNIWRGASIKLSFLKPLATFWVRAYIDVPMPMVGSSPFLYKEAK